MTVRKTGMNHFRIRSALAATLLLAPLALPAQDVTEALANRLIQMRGQVDELQKEVDGWLERAEATDQSEDECFGKGRRDDEVPEELKELLREMGHVHALFGAHERILLDDDAFALLQVEGDDLARELAGKGDGPTSLVYVEIGDKQRFARDSAFEHLADASARVRFHLYVG